MAGKIMLLSDIFPPKTGGSGRWFREIYSRLPRERVLVAAGTGAGTEEFDRTHDLDIMRLPLEMRTRGIRGVANVKHYWRLSAQIRRIVKERGISSIHCARNLPEGFMAWMVRQRTGVKYTCYVHGEDVGVSATSRELAWMTCRVFAGATRVIANSNNTREILIKQWKLPEPKVVLLYPGVDTKRFVPAAMDATVREQLGWTGRKVLLTVGRLQQRKGHDCLIRALKAIRLRHPEVLYAILGDGEELPRLKALAQSEGVGDAVQFIGEADDEALLRCYQQCDLFVLPNRTVGNDFEGFGMVLLEAQACGRAVVAGASGGTAETMRIPETGRVVNCDTPEPLAALLVEWLDEPALLREMGERGRAWVCERFDWEALARQAGELFRDD